MTEPLDLDPAALLAAEESCVLETRREAVAAMDRLLGWCDVHSVDPQTQPGAVPVHYGGDKLVQVGGEGTPKVAELCFGEFAIAGRVGVIATTNKAADYLDLRHRLPNVHAAVRDLVMEVWVARKVAALSRRLDVVQVQVVDLAVAAAAEESASRILAIAEAKVIEADPATHRERIAAEAKKKGVWLPRKRPGQRVDDIDGEADVQGIRMRLSGAGALALEETIDQVAHALADTHVPADAEDVPTMDQFRAQAAELLADPYATTRLLDGPDEDDTASSEGEESAPDPEPAPSPEPSSAPSSVRRPRRKPATVVVHIDQRVLSGEVDGVARVDGIGALLREQVTELLRGRDVTVQPVVDLNVGRAVNGYEHPTACKQRTLYRTSRDVFPHSTRVGVAQLDHDHPIPYEANGPPGQTGDHNDAPLARRDHRAKTHLGYQVRQLGLGAYRWQTPHGLTRVVTGRGTTVAESIHITDTDLIGEIYDTRIAIEPA